MEFYTNDTPFHSYFDSAPVVVNRTDDVVLYIDYLTSDEKSVKLSAYSQAEGKYVFDEKVSSPPDIERVWNLVVAQFGRKSAVEGWKKVWKDFLAVADGIVEVELDFEETNEFYQCDQCGSYNEDKGLFFFAPGNPHAPFYPSIAYHHEFGCYGGYRVLGDPIQIITTLNHQIQGLSMLNDSEFKSRTIAELQKLVDFTESKASLFG